MNELSESQINGMAIEVADEIVNNFLCYAFPSEIPAEKHEEIMFSFTSDMVPVIEKSIKNYWEKYGKD